ncbi:MAG: hypothetical protein FWC60_00835 [Firmicutes bacterium]|nr:hypothetical protein [Bacillota bacterium]
MRKPKKLLLALLVLAMAFAMASPALAAPASTVGQTAYLKGSGVDFTETWNNVFYVPDKKVGDNPNIWHLVYSGKDISKVSSMQVTFANGYVFKWVPGQGFSTNGGGNNPGWVIVAPYDWTIAYIDKGNNNASGSFLVTNESGNGISFNISGFHQGGPDVSNTGIIKLMKLVQSGNNKPVLWDINNPLYPTDNPNIWFDLYDGAAVVQSTQVDISGYITFTGLDLTKEYTIKERFTGDIGDKYEAIDPITTKPWQEGDDATLNFSPKTYDPATGRVSQDDVIISNGLDPDLKAYEGYDNYRTAETSVVTFDNSVLFRSNPASDSPPSYIPVAPFWKQQMINYNGTDKFFNDLDGLWLDRNVAPEEAVKPQFIWNTGDFSNRDKAVNGDTVIFEKSFTTLDNLADGTMPLYVTGDNAFLVFVNGQYVGKSDAVVNELQKGAPLDAANLAYMIGDRGHDYINTGNKIETWSRTYNFDIKDFIKSGDNTITIVGINEAEDINTEGQDFHTDPMINPGGFIFGCEVKSYTDKLRFINQLPAEEGALAVNADLNVSYDKVIYEPIYQKILLYDSTTVSKSVYKFPNSNENNGNGSGGNGAKMTYVAVNVAAASSGDGVPVELAMSDPNNTGLGLYYNVKIVGNQLTVSFNDADGVVLPDNSIGIFLQATPFDSRPNIKHDGNILTATLPSDTGDVVYLYLHSAGGIMYNDKNNIIGWKEVSRETLPGDYKGTLKLEITGPNDFSYVNENFDGNIGAVLDKLEPGDYTVSLSGSSDYTVIGLDGTVVDPGVSFDQTISKDVTVEKGQTTSVPFSVNLQGPTVEIKPV